MDCHSKPTKWPWYSNVAPISWLVQRDVDEGRRELDPLDRRGRGRGDDRVDPRGIVPPLAVQVE